MIDITTILVAMATLMATYILCKSIFKPRLKRGSTLPGPKGLPLVGLFFRLHPEHIHVQVLPYVQKYGEIFQLNLMGTNMVLLNSVRLIRKCFTEDPFKHVMSDRPPFHYSKLIPEGGSIACAEIGGGPEHSRLRKAFNKGFYIYGDGVKIFEEKVCNEIDNLIRRLDDTQEQEVEIFAIIQQTIVSIISVLMIGEELLENDERYEMIIGFMYGMNRLLSPANNSILLSMPFMKYVPGPWREGHTNVVAHLEIITKQILRKQKESYDANVVRGIVDYLIGLQIEEERNKRSGSGDDEIFFTDGKIVGFLGDVIDGGITTTLSTMTAALLCLLLHPDVQKKGQEEVFRVIGKERKPTLKDRSNCPYIEAITNEVHRYIAVVPLGLPHLVVEETVLEGYHIPAESVVLANNFHVFHDEKIWGDPWVFRPERFLDDKGDMIPRDHPLRQSLMPFSNGKRRCVGEEFARSRTFLILTTIIQRWTLIKLRDEPTTCDPRSSYYGYDITIAPKPFYCKAVKNF